MLLIFKIDHKSIGRFFLNLFLFFLGEGKILDILHNIIGDPCLEGQTETDIAIGRYLSGVRVQQ